MSDWSDLERHGAQLAAWGRRYHEGLRGRPVRAQTKPGEIAAKLAPAPPEEGEGMDAILADLDPVVMPGITHWQHPGFFAYFPSNATPPAVLADFVAAIVSPQCMLWQTSPAATEMEARMMDWMRQAVGLPEGFAGVIQDSASSATLAAVLTMRERALGFTGNATGLSGRARLRLYTSAEGHSSIERAAWVAGTGGDNLVRVPTEGPMRGMDPAALRAAVRADREAGYLPAGLIACTGGTSTGACDPVDALCDVARDEDLYVHLDAAWAGSAMICPEHRALWEGAARCDSIVFNPHKWLGTQFDLAVHLVREPDALRRTLAIRPEYLKTTGQPEVTDFSEWSVPLGRRFRALKLWFLLRAYGLGRLRGMIRDHCAWSAELCEVLRADHEIVTEPVLSLFTFRPRGRSDAEVQALVDRVNDDGRIYLTQTLVDGRKAIRFQCGAFFATRDDVMGAADVLRELA